MSANPIKVDLEHDRLSGELSQTPLFAILRRIQRAGMTGTLELARNGQQRWLSFEDGELRAARSSREDHRIGRSLVLWGYLSEHDLERALIKQKTSKSRLDQILVERGLVARSVLDVEARRLMEQIVTSALSWPDGSFQFRMGKHASDDDISFSLSVTEMIIEGIRRIPESQKFLELLGDPAKLPTAAAPETWGLDATRLPVEANFLLSRMDGKTSVRELLSLAPSSRLEAAKILYTLVYCGFVDLKAAPAAAAETRAEASPEADEPRVGHRALVHGTYRRIDWLSHYDLLGVKSDASGSEIDAAYARLSKLFDPALRRRSDLANCGRELTVLSHRLEEAYETLSQVATREAYDRTIRKGEALLIEGMHESPLAPPERQSREKIRRWTASRNYKRAQELIEQKDYYPAIQMLEEAVQFAPDNPDYRLLLGQAKLKNRWWREEGIEELQEAARLDPTCAAAQAALAEAYLEQGNLDTALTCARTALNVAPLGDKDPYRELELRVEDSLHSAQAHAPAMGKLLRSVSPAVFGSAPASPARDRAC